MKNITKVETARILLMHSVHTVLDGCGNSYVNSYTEAWLRAAKEVGAYHGPVVGRIIDVKQKWEDWLDEHGLPEIPSA